MTGTGGEMEFARAFELRKKVLLRTATDDERAEYERLWEERKKVLLGRIDRAMHAFDKDREMLAHACGSSASLMWTFFVVLFVSCFAASLAALWLIGR